MIIIALIELIKGLVNVLFGSINLPAMPTEIEVHLSALVFYIEQGISLVWLIFPQGLVFVLLPIILIVSNAMTVYRVFMWVLRKIPFLGLD